ncbi:5102_t:CDS:2, partial [Entrophospora sp. SA101]
EEKSSVNIQYITETQKDYKKKTFLSIVLNKRKYDDFGLDPEYKANVEVVHVILGPEATETA